jgi:hypothetical protein
MISLILASQIFLLVTIDTGAGIAKLDKLAL